MTERERELLETGVILLVWAAAIAIIHPRGDFPLNDDWDFAIATWNFARTGHFQFTEFTATSLRAQILWGALWTRLFGESFEVLRASTLTLAAGTIVVVHRMLCRVGLARFGRLLATFALMFHPVFVISANTYMTEIPFVFASAVALYFFWRGIEEERAGLVAAGCVAAIASWFVRQTGVTNLFAPLVVVVWRRRRGWKRDASLIVATLLLFVTLLLFKRDWLAGSVVEFANHFKMWTESSFRLPQQISVFYHYNTFNVQNAALFFLPLTAALVIGRRSRRELIWLISAAVLIFMRVQSLIRQGHPMPYFASPFCCDIFGGNTLADFGLGQMTLTDIWELHYPYPFHLTDAGRLLLTYGSVVAGALLVGAFVAAMGRNTLTLLAGGSAIAGTLALFGSGLYIDRYSFDSAWPVVFILAFAVHWERRSARAIAAIVLVAMAVFSTLSVQEYLAWNRARWTAFERLRQQGIPVQQIDGGSEPRYWYELAHTTQRRRRQLNLYFPRPYLLAFRPIPGYQVVTADRFEGWFGWHRGAIYTLRKGITDGTEVRGSKFE